MNMIGAVLDYTLGYEEAMKRIGSCVLAIKIKAGEQYGERHNKVVPVWDGDTLKFSFRRGERIITCRVILGKDEVCVESKDPQALLFLKEHIKAALAA